MENEDIIANPAARMMAFVHKVKQNKGSDMSPIRIVIGKIVDIDSDDTGKVMKVIADVWQIPTQIRTELNSVVGLDAGPYELVVRQLEEGLTDLTPDAQVHNFLSRMNQNLLLQLSMISTVLKKDVKTPHISSEKRTDILADLEDILADIKQAEFDQDFTLFAMDRVQAVIYAIQHYDILGSAEIISNVDRMFGGLIRQAPSISQSGTKKSIVKKILKAMAGILFVMNLTKGALDIEQKVTSLIGDASDNEAAVTK